MLIGRMARGALVAWAATTLSTAAAGADYTVLTSGQPSGTMTVTSRAQGREVAYRYNDRGRGPDLRSIVATDAEGRPTRLIIEGVNYYKLPVAERFERNGATASWHAANDSGSSTATAFYLPDEGTPEHMAMLARALIKAPGSEAPLLPAGRARLSHLLDHDLNVDGKVVCAKLYALSGLDFGPSPLWLDENGELLLEGSDWFATVRRGLEGQARKLIALQQQTLAANARTHAQRLLRRPSGPVAITNVAMFDAPSRTVRRDMTVIVKGNRIAEVVPAASAKVPAGATIIDGRGKTLLPGLWDMHVHVSEDTQGLLHLAAGVTSVRDLANNADELAERRRRFDAMELIGPRIVPAGFIDGPGPLAGPIKVLAATPDEMRAAIRGYAGRGYKGIKLYSSLDPKLVPVAVQEAHRLGLRVSGHVPAGMTLREAAAAGYDEVHHLNYVALNFMDPEINAKTNGITRITAVAEHAWEIDPASSQVREFIADLKARGVVVDPTMTLYEDHLLGRPGTPNPTLAPVVDRLPPVVRRGSFGAGLATNDAEAARNARSYTSMLGLLKALYDGGVTLVAGTDATTGFTYHRELELYEQAGIPRADILHIATLGAARVTGLDRELGSIEPGKLADLLLVDGDPTERMADIRKTTLVMKDGALFDPARLYAEVGVAGRTR